MSSGPSSPAAFVAKWKGASLPERAASQEFFIDLCRLLGQPTPAEHDKTGAVFTFEKGVTLAGPASPGAGSKGDYGYADVWFKDHFAIEFKRQNKYDSLKAAYDQLLKYREALDNPPLLIVSDISTIEIHTNFTGAPKRVHRFTLDEIESNSEALAVLRRAFTDPYSLKPSQTVEQITEAAARKIGELAQRLRDRGHDPHDAAHFLMKCMFCLFAEDAGDQLLPKDTFHNLLARASEALTKNKADEAQVARWFDELFSAMRTGGHFWGTPINFFNGGLFDETPAIPLNLDDLGILRLAAAQDWASVEPAIFGTLFERSLDPSKRAQIGAHYTSRDDILLVVEPVIVEPLRREWLDTRDKIEQQLERRRAATTPATKKKADADIARLIERARERLASVVVLDPACGSGNFLYVSLQRLLDLEKEIINYAAQPHLAQNFIPHVSPTQLRGVEINPYAAELAQIVIWIGYLQWMRDNGFKAPADPILKPFQSIENRDAILAWAMPHNPSPIADGGGREGASSSPPPLPSPDPLPSGERVATKSPGEGPHSHPLPLGEGGVRSTPGEGVSKLVAIPVYREGALCTGPASWPEADFIVGNPPFLGTKMLRAHLGDAYVEALFATYDGRIPGFSDLCCYWFELAREKIEQKPDVRAGLLATQAIRNGAARRVLERIKDTGDIFMAWADRVWVLDGAAVQISIVGFGGKTGDRPVLDGVAWETINANLSGAADTTKAERLAENLRIGFVGDVKSGSFDIAWTIARSWLAEPSASGEPPIKVLRPWFNGMDITSRRRAMWIVDFPSAMPVEIGATFGTPFEHVRREVKPKRDLVKRKKYRDQWWIHAEPCDAMRDAVAPCSRFVITPVLTKFRLFAWSDGSALPDHQLVAFARSDDYFLGVLHSSVHELWARRMGTQLREAESGFRYTSTTCFETFPLPWSPGKEPAPGTSPLHDAIAQAAKDLNDQRENWLNPPQWIDAIAQRIDAQDDFADVASVSGEEARRLIRESAIMAAAAKDPKLKKRTLTNLYNERPTWLRLAHKRLDEAVLAAYASVNPEGGWNTTWAEVWEETGAGQPLPDNHAMSAKRKEVDESVLAALLALNLQRASK